MKNFIRKAIYLGIIFGVFSFAGCQNPLAPSRETPSSTNMGRVAIVIGDSARTIAPGTEDFTKYTLTFAGPGVHADVNASGGSAEVELSVGEWTISATGYTGTEPDYTAVAEGSKTVTVSSSATTNANILLKPKTGGDLAKGAFSYSLEVPYGLESRQLVITKSTGEAVKTIDLTYSYAGIEGTEELDAGQYLIGIRLQMGTGDGARYAGLTEALHIYTGMTSTLEKIYEDADFLIAVSEGFDLTELVTAPAMWAAPVATFADQTQYTGTIAWKESNSETPVTGIFAANTVYKAVLTLSTAPGTWNSWGTQTHTFTGVAENSFSYTGATSVTNAEDSGVVIITFVATEDGTVSSVTVNEGPVSVAQGGSKTFTATVGGSVGVPQTVTWSVTGNIDAGTTITTTGGKLNIALGESAASLTVTATSLANTSVTGTTTVTVTAAVVKDIPTAVELAKIGVDDGYPLGGKYKLTASFSLSDWTSIGTLAEPFAGVIDGDNKTITITSFDSTVVSSATYLGVFGYVKGSSTTSKAGVKDLTISSSVNQTTTMTTGQAIGLLAGYTENTEITGITLSGSFTFGAQKNIYLGGVVGYAQKGTVVDGCSSSMTMAIDAGNGNGLVAGMYYGYVGGFVGAFKDGVEITDCHNSGSITADSTLASSQVFAGGITGGSYYQFTIDYQGSVQDCSYTGNLLAKAKGFWTFAGGIAGTMVSGDVGNDATTTRIVRCFATGTISVDGTASGNPYVGGIVGYNYNGALVSQSYFTGKVIATKTGDYTGGIAGYNSQRAAPNNSRIEDCWSSGTVTGFNNAGGIVGQNQVNTYIRRCYSTAIVSTTGTSTTHTGTGGIAGLNASAMTDAITGCVALNPSITSATTNTGNKVHRVSGTNSSAVGLSHNLAYSNMILTNDGAYTPDKGADKVDGEDIATLPVQGNYVALGWDFSSVWKMVGLYPALQWQKGTAGITADFNYGDITINGSDGSNVIYKDAARSPNSVTLSVGADYTAVKWYIDGAADPTETGNAITLNTANYSAKAHSITFTGTRGGVLYAQVLPFTVKN